ncbi:ATP-binding protein [Nocardioides sp. YJ-D4]
MHFGASPQEVVLIFQLEAAERFRVGRRSEVIKGVGLSTDTGSVATWLKEVWPAEGPAIVFIEGFSGVGKSRLGRDLVQSWPGVAVRVEVGPDTLGLEDLLLEVAMHLDELGNSTMSDREDFDFVVGLRAVMRTGALLVLDDAQHLQDPVTRLPSADLRRLVDLVDQSNAGRLMLITNQAPADGEWLDKCRRIVLQAPPESEALVLLEALLRDTGREADIPESLRPDVVRWLGGNPRALRALVACLGDEPLESLIEIEPDAWLLRDEIVSPQLIQRLETYFLTRTLDQLAGNSLLLLELLSVYRKPFRKDAIERLDRVVAELSQAQSTLQSRYLMEFHVGYFALHPVMRRLARARLSQNPRREHNAHQAAAEHFVRRLRRGTARLSLAQAGESFVEARYHLLTAGADSEFENLASDYRRELALQYRSAKSLPKDPGARRQLLATLLAALTHEDRGYAHLRINLARLLLERAGTDDSRLAIRQLTLASRESKDVYCWNTRLDLAISLEGLSVGRTVAEQAVLAVAEGSRWQVFYRFAAHLVSLERPIYDRDALAWLDRGLMEVPAKDQRLLYALSSFTLSRNRRRDEAIELLLGGYERLGGATDANSWRLLEEAAFIAAVSTNRDKRLSDIREVAADNAWGESLQVLCEVLRLQGIGAWAAAADVARSANSPALTAQRAFSLLCSGEVAAAEAVVTGERIPQNRSTAWLRALIALCARRADLYAEEMAGAVDRQLTLSEASDPSLWFKVWDRIPSRLESYPAFYFPRLPASLTGLRVDLVRLPEQGPNRNSVSLREIQLPTLNAGSEVVDELTEVFQSRTLLLNIEGNLIMSNDSYNVSGQAGAVGPGAVASGNTFNQYVAGLNPEQMANLAAELGTLRQAMRARAVAPEEDMAIAEIARAEMAAGANDQSVLQNALMKAGRWAWDTANAIGTPIASAALKAAIGL